MLAAAGRDGANELAGKGVADLDYAVGVDLLAGDAHRLVAELEGFVRHGDPTTRQIAPPAMG